MTNEEFSNTFTTLLNSYATQAEFGDQASRAEVVLDEYEKSVLLTQAQDIIVKSYFDRTLNPQGQGFDDSARRQIDFSSLIKVATVDMSEDEGGFDERSYVAQLPRRYTASSTTTSSTASTTTTYTTTTASTQTNSPQYDNTDVLVILNEKLLKYSGSGSDAEVVSEYVIKPISYSEYDRQMTKAYSKPLKKQAWRIFHNSSAGFDVQSEIIPREKPGTGEAYKYRVRYVRRPQPIVLEALTDSGLSIDGYTEETPCELNPIMHIDILNKAVELALATRGTYQRPAQEQTNR